MWHKTNVLRRRVAVAQDLTVLPIPENLYRQKWFF
jgi:hypothetical protein